MTQTKTYPRLPRSLKKAVELQSKEGGTSINQFVAARSGDKLPDPPLAAFEFP